MSCWKLMCFNDCVEKLNDFDILDIILYVQNKNILRYCLKLLTKNVYKL